MRFLCGVLFLSAVSLAASQGFFPCHPSKASPNFEVKCSRVVLPDRICKRCPLRPTVKNGQFEKCDRIYDTESADCQDALKEYVSENPCDTARQEAVSKMLAGDAAAKKIVDYWLYSVCENCCDCVPMGAEEEDYASLSKSHSAANPTLWKEDRGNCPAHAFFDVCKVLPHVTYFTKKGGRDVEAPKACDLLRSWHQSPASSQWESNPKTEIVPALRTFLRGLLNAINCNDFSIWGVCQQMEEDQNHLELPDGYTEPPPDKPVTTPPSTTSATSTTTSTTSTSTETSTSSTSTVTSTTATTTTTKARASPSASPSVSASASASARASSSASASASASASSSASASAVPDTPEPADATSTPDSDRPTPGKVNGAGDGPSPMPSSEASPTEAISPSKEPADTDSTLPLTTPSATNSSENDGTSEPTNTPALSFTPETSVSSSDAPFATLFPEFAPDMTVPPTVSASTGPASTTASPGSVSATASPGSVSATASPGSASASSSPGSVSATASPGSASASSSPGSVSATASPVSASVSSSPGSVSATASPGSASATASPEFSSTPATPGSSSTPASPESSSTPASPESSSTPASPGPSSTTTGASPGTSIPPTPSASTSVVPESATSTDSSSGGDGDGNPFSVQSPEASSEDSEAACFPASATVELESGEIISISKLRIGDSVRVNENTFSEVFLFSHRTTDSATSYIQISAGDKTLTTTPGHIIHANNRLIAAKDVAIGSTVRHLNGELVVTDIRAVSSTGLYNPHTLHGDIAVDGFVTSTYTTAIPSRTATSLLAPLRALYSFGFINDAIAGRFLGKGYESLGL